MQLSNDDKSRFDIGKLVNNNQGDVRDSINMMMLLPRIYTFFTPVATIGLLEEIQKRILYRVVTDVSFHTCMAHIIYAKVSHNKI